MTAKFYLDTNALILLSGLNEDLSELSKHISENHVELSIGHVQIDEEVSGDNFNQNFEKALRKLRTYEITVNLEPTVIAIFDVSRFDLCKFGSKDLGKIYDELRTEIECCERKKPKPKLNIARDAIIALSSLNHDYFITADECLLKSWRKVVENNQENKVVLQKTYSIPKLIHCKKPKGILNTIMRF